MVIKSLELKNFRNYKDYKIDFSPITVIYGPNGIGKSNILEALTCLAHTKSYRTNHEENLILYNENYAQIQGNLENERIFFLLQKENNNLKKYAKVNNVPKRLSDLIGKLKLVIFTPESLQIVTGSPLARRKFLDICISQIDRNYFNNLLKYKKILKQRNELLKNIALGKSDDSELDFWNEKMAHCAKIIIQERINLIQFINTKINYYYQDLSGKNEEISLNYQSKFMNLDSIYDYLNAHKKEEIKFQKTLFGPHLEDIKIFINNKAFAEVSSRGEIRSLVLVLKILEIKFLENTGSKNILLLLDDIFSELDTQRRNRIIKIIKEKQTIITTTDKNFIKDGLGNISFISPNI